MLVGCSVSAKDITQMKRAGFDFVEMAGRELTALDESEFVELQRSLEQQAIPCLALNAYCPPYLVLAGANYDAAHIRAYAIACATRASALGVRQIGIGSPASRTLPKHFDGALAVMQFREAIAITAEEFGRYNIRVGIEAVGYCYCNFINHLTQAAEVAKSLEAISTPPGVVMDFYNMEQSGEGELDFRFVMPQLLHVHLSDDAGDPSRRSFLRPEKEILHRTRLQKLVQYGYDHTVSLEVDGVSDLKQARKSCQLVREVWLNAALDEERKRGKT